VEGAIAGSTRGVDAFGSFFLPFFKRDFRLKKEADDLRGGLSRFAVRAVKAAYFAFTGAKRTALTDQASGEAHFCVRKGNQEGRCLERFRERVID